MLLVTEETEIWPAGVVDDGDGDGDDATGGLALAGTAPPA